MMDNFTLYNRKSIRLKGYDYSRDGAYYITINTQNREPLFGHIDDTGMHLNDAGRMIEKWYNKLPEKFTGVVLDEYIVMPDHFHCIIWIDDSGDFFVAGQTHGSAPTDFPDLIDIPNPINIPRIMQWFKTMTTNEYIRGVKNEEWPPFDKRLWQRNYWEHIIRDDESLFRIRQYIINNPRRWYDDNSMRVREPQMEYYCGTGVGADTWVRPYTRTDDMYQDFMMPDDPETVGADPRVCPYGFGKRPDGFGKRPDDYGKRPNGYGKRPDDSGIRSVDLCQDIFCGSWAGTGSWADTWVGLKRVRPNRVRPNQVRPDQIRQYRETSV